MPADNRSIIIEQALNLFAARGYDAVSVQEIVESAGITKPTLYHYFGSKHGVLEAILSRYFETLYCTIKAAAEYEGDLPLNLYRLVAAYFQFAGENPVFYRLLLSTNFAPPESESFQIADELFRQQHDLLELLFAQALEHMKGRHKRYAATFLGMINTYITFALNGHSELSDELVYQAVHQFMHGIYS